MPKCSEVMIGWTHKSKIDYKGDKQVGPKVLVIHTDYDCTTGMDLFYLHNV